VTERQRSAVGLATWLLALVLALAGLHALGSGPLATPPVRGFGRWLEARDAATAAFAVLRLVALALGWYLLAATILALGLRLTNGSGAGAATAVEATTPAFVRRLVRGAAGLTLAAGAATIAGPALAGASTAPGHAAAVTMRRLEDDPVVMRRLADGGGAPPVTMRRLPDAGAEDAGPPAPSAAPRTWTVQPGQHLWLVAEEVLRTAWQQPPTDRQTDPYWRTLVAANRDVLADPHNADLLFPGQVLEVPDPPPRPATPDV
jgi:nucleoid-associated protein YgaU